MVKPPESRAGLKKRYANATSEVRAYFEHLPALIDAFPLEVALAYVFAQLELAHNRALYCAIVKKHRGDSELAHRAVDAHRLNRDEFRTLYATVLGQPIPGDAQKLIREAETVRDKVMHGKPTTGGERAAAISRVLTYAEAMNQDTAVQERLGSHGLDLEPRD